MAHRIFVVYSKEALYNVYENDKFNQKGQLSYVGK